MGEGLNGAGKLIVAVLKDAQIPPTLLPIGLEPFGLGVEVDGQGQVLPVTGCCSPSGEIIELDRRLLIRGNFLHRAFRTRERERGNQGEEYEAAGGPSGENGDCHVLPGMPCKFCDVGRIRRKNIAGWIPRNSVPAREFRILESHRSR